MNDDEAKSTREPEAGAIQIEGPILGRPDTLLFDEMGCRVCRIHAGDVTGSAFLIAPDLIMTAAHVVTDLRTTRQNVRVAFEEPKRFGALIVDLGAADELDPVVADFNRELDYAVLRLPSQVGYTKAHGARGGIRGWFDITKQPPTGFPRRPTRVLHYPLLKNDADGDRTSLACSPGSLLTTDGGIWHHNANTRHGSSGGICLSAGDMFPSAIHLGSDGGRNYSVSIRTVLNDLRVKSYDLYHEISATPLNKLCPPLTGQGMPILNRESLIRKLVGMLAGGDCRPMFILGPPETGRTFIKEVLSTFSPHTHNCYVHLTSKLGDYAPLALQLHKGLLNLNYPAYESVEPEVSFFRRALSELMEKAEEMARDRETTIVLYLDGLDSRTEALDELVEHMSRLAPQMTRVRLVLAGSAQMTHSGADTFELTALQEDHHVSFLEALRHYEQLEVSAEVVQVLMSFLRTGSVLNKPIAVQSKMISEFVSALRGQIAEGTALP